MIKVQFLGTSGSVPTESRGLPAIYLGYNGNRMLFDCGEGTQRQMRIAKIPFMKLNRIFISHFHADHCMGLGGLIQTMDLFKRKEKLEIYGPAGIKDVIDKIITTGHFILEEFDLEVIEVKPRGVVQIFADDESVIKCAKLDHTVPCLGFSLEEKEKRKFHRKKALELGVPEGPLFRKLQAGEAVSVGSKRIEPDQVLGTAVKGKKVTYISDSRPCALGVELAMGSDILIHDSTFSHDLQESAIEGKHSTSKEAAEIAKRAGAKALYLTHISQRYTKTEDLQKDARTVFPKTQVVSDFDIITV